ncbi:MAG: DUF3347 domain-containing protein [Lutibacter sp.]|jgi:hypothetical protein
MKKSIYVLAFSVLLLGACKNDKKQVESNEMQTKEMQMDTDDGHDHSSMDESTMHENKDIEATTQKSASTSEIIDRYLQIKNSLAEDNSKKAAEGGKMMLAAFSNFDMNKLSESQYKEYMEILEDAKEHAEHISDSPIDHQREHFENLSTDLNDLISLLGTNKTLYVTYCPMYNNKKGAIWLSETKTIKNPYLGSKMPTCGEIQKQIN